MATPAELTLGRWSSRSATRALLSRPEFNACCAHRRLGLLSLLRHIRQTAAARALGRLVRGCDAAFIDGNASSGVECSDGGCAYEQPPGMYAFGAAAMCVVAFNAADNFMTQSTVLDADGANAAVMSAARRFAAVFVRLVETVSARPGRPMDVFVCGFGVGAALAAATMSHLRQDDADAVCVLGVELYACPAFCGRNNLTTLRGQQWWYPSCTQLRCISAPAPRLCTGCVEPDFATVVMRCAPQPACGCVCRVLRGCAALCVRHKKRVALDEYADSAAHAANMCGCGA